MVQNLTMAELLAKQSKEAQTKSLKVFRGQEVEGEVVAILPQELVLELGTKSEGILQKKELPKNELESLKVGSRFKVFVLQAENDYGQVVLGMQKPIQRLATSFGKVGQRTQNYNEKRNSQWKKFEQALKNGEVIKGMGLEVNKGGLIVETNGIRGFLPFSQVILSQAADLEKLIGQEISLMVIEVEPNQNRLIFSQKTNITEDLKNKLSTLKPGDAVKGTVAAILPFGLFVKLEEPDLSGVEGLVHTSEISWEKHENVPPGFSPGMKVSANVISLDPATARVNLSIKQLDEDPLSKIAEKLHPDDLVKGKVSKISSMGVTVDLGAGLEGLIHASKLEGDQYKIDQEVTCLVDSIDVGKRRINLVPFITTTKGLIYK